MKRLGSKISYILTVVVIIGLLLFSIGFISRFTNSFTSDFKTFYVEYNGKKITSDCKDVLFECGATNKINVYYSLEFLDNEKKDYTVQVLPNVTKENDFEYIVDEEKYLFSGIGDLTEYFEIEKDEDSFTIKATMDVFKILKKKYEGKNVTYTETDGKNLLKLVIGNADNSVKISMAFTVTEQVEDIRFNKENIIF